VRGRRGEQVLVRPDRVPRLVTSSSRIASSGGLVTCANELAEVVEQQPRPFERHATGVSVPIEPIGSGRPGHRRQQMRSSSSV
jgi:hypothetical protein